MYRYIHPDFYRPIYQENPSKIDYTIAGHTVIAAWTLSQWIRRFSRALRKVDFPKVVVKVAMDFPWLSAPGPSWRGGFVKSSFTPGLPSHVFIPSLQRVYDAIRNVPDLLNAGLLDILVLKESSTIIGTRNPGERQCKTRWHSATIRALPELSRIFDFPTIRFF
jgi:hypothetical protein